MFHVLTFGGISINNLWGGGGEAGQPRSFTILPVSNMCGLTRPSVHRRPHTEAIGHTNKFDFRPLVCD